MIPGMTEEELKRWEFRLQKLSERLDARRERSRERLREISRRERSHEDFKSLALAGLCGEMIGHELNASEWAVNRALMDVPGSIGESARIQFQALIERLRGFAGGTSRDILQDKVSGRDLAEMIQLAFPPQVRSRIQFRTGFLEMVVTCYKHRLVPALIQLVSNGLSWSKGSGAISLDFSDGVISVEDSGPGIPENLLETIFEPFFSTRPGGRGIGLYLVREALRSMSWEIIAGNGSVDGFRGACFRIAPPESALE